MQFNLFFPRPGMHRIWLQFQRKGVVNTAAFNLPIVDESDTVRRAQFFCDCAIGIAPDRAKSSHPARGRHKSPGMPQR